MELQLDGAYILLIEAYNRIRRAVLTVSWLWQQRPRFPSFKCHQVAKGCILPSSLTQRGVPSDSFERADLYRPATATSKAAATSLHISIIRVSCPTSAQTQTAALEAGWQQKTWRWVATPPLEPVKQRLYACISSPDRLVHL